MSELARWNRFVTTALTLVIFFLCGVGTGMRWERYRRDCTPLKSGVQVITKVLNGGDRQ